MTKHALMLRELEHEIEWLMRHTDPQSGAPMRPDLYTDTRYTGFSAARMLTAYVHPQSRYHASPALLSAITDALNYMEKNKRPSGLFDLSSCNFDSAPDTAFTINAMMDAAVLLKTADVPGRDGLLEKLIHLIETACEGICAGGFHTPNHRWAISAALKTAALLTGRQDFSDRADIYLREGLDISRDGEFAERSTGTYNGVNDDQMIRLYLATGDRLYLCSCENTEAKDIYEISGIMGEGASSVCYEAKRGSVPGRLKEFNPLSAWMDGASPVRLKRLKSGRLQCEEGMKVYRQWLLPQSLP